MMLGVYCAGVKLGSRPPVLCWHDVVHAHGPFHAKLLADIMSDPHL